MLKTAWVFTSRPRTAAHYVKLKFFLENKAASESKERKVKQLKRGYHVISVSWVMHFLTEEWAIRTKILSEARCTLGKAVPG